MRVFSLQRGDSTRIVWKNAKGSATRSKGSKVNVSQPNAHSTGSPLRLKSAQDTGIVLQLRANCIAISYPATLDSNIRAQHYRNLSRHSGEIVRFLQGHHRCIASEKAIITACVYAGDFGAVDRYIDGNDRHLYTSSPPDNDCVPIVPGAPLTFETLTTMLVEFGLCQDAERTNEDLVTANQWLAEGCPHERVIEWFRRDLAERAVRKNPPTRARN